MKWERGGRVMDSEVGERGKDVGKWVRRGRERYSVITIKACYE